LNLFLFELKRNYKPFLVWAIVEIFMVAAGMSKFSASVKSGQSINQFLEKMPPMFQALFGVGQFNLSTAFGFYCVLFGYLVLISVVHATLLGSTIVSKEERDKTSEFLYTRPISRSQILTQKILLSAILMIFLNLIAFFASFIFLKEVGNGAVDSLILIKMMGGMLALQIVFFSIGLVCSAGVKNAKIAPAIASGILLFAFLLYQFLELDQRLNGWKVLTPFAYFTAKNITSPEGVPVLFCFLSAGLVIGGITGAYLLYRNRDINF